MTSPPHSSDAQVPAGRPWFRSRLAMLLCGVVVAGGAMLYYARGAWPVVSSVVAIELLVQAGYWLACYLLGRCCVRRWRAGEIDSALGVATSAALGFALIGFATLALGLAGWLSSPVAYALLLLAAIAGAADWLASAQGRRKTSLAAFLAQESSGGWTWLPAAAAVGVMLVAATLLPGTLWRPDDPHPYDSLVYHLQVPREWFELGRIVPLTHNVYSFFPFNIECHYLLADYLRGGPWQAMYQAQFLSLSLSLLTSLTLWGGVAPRFGRQAAALSVLAFLTLPWVIMLSCVSYVESGMLLFAALAMVWFTQGMICEQGRLRRFVLAGLFAGMACGVKLTNVPMLLLALPLAAILALAAGRRRGQGSPSPCGRAGAVGGQRGTLARPLLSFLLCGLVCLSPWLIRNAVWAKGNPLFPVAMRWFGQAHFTEAQVERFERAHQAAPEHASLPARLQRAGGEIALNWRYGYLLFPLALAAGALAWRSAEARLHLLLMALILFFWLTNTHLMGRFYVLATIPATLLIASLPRRGLTPAAVLLSVAAVWCFAGPTSLPAYGTGRNVSELLEPWAEKGRQGLFGLSDYSALEAPEIRQMAESGHPVLFVGDAAVFVQPLPMSQLHYCTIFDLQTGEGRGGGGGEGGRGRGWIDASWGPAPATCPAEAAVVIDVSECQRLRSTYYAVPELQIPAQDRYWRLLVRGGR